jgi:endonuclease/exonuclease/phosphatase family metal-dependent hydrolase
MLPLVRGAMIDNHVPRCALTPIIQPCAPSTAGGWPRLVPRPRQAREPPHPTSRTEPWPSLLAPHGVSIAGLQEVHPPQSDALSKIDEWGMFPTNHLQNKVIWDKTAWTMTDSRLIDIPYFGGAETRMPLVQLISASGQVVCVWSIHNPIGPHKWHVEALAREVARMTALKAKGVPVILLGDFNDGHDEERRSHCVLTPTLVDACGGSSNPCSPPNDEIDHLYGANLT